MLLLEHVGSLFSFLELDEQSTTHVNMKKSAIHMHVTIMMYNHYFKQSLIHYILLSPTTGKSHNGSEGVQVFLKKKECTNLPKPIHFYIPLQGFDCMYM